MEYFVSKELWRTTLVGTVDRAWVIAYACTEVLPFEGEDAVLVSFESREEANAFFRTLNGHLLYRWSTESWLPEDPDDDDPDGDGEEYEEEQEEKTVPRFRLAS